MNKRMYFTVFAGLVSADLAVFKQTFFNQFINIAIWVVLTIVVMGYIMPFFGLPHDFGVFQFAGALAAAGLFEIYASSIELISDFQGDRTIDYRLTLPIPSQLVLLSKAVYFFIVYFVLSLFVFPMGKLSLWNQLDLYKISYIKLLCIMIVQNIFYACLVLWIGSKITDMGKLSNVWRRFIFPMWFLGGFQFSWYALYTITPVFAYINLLNPMIYITEALRVAVLGQPGYLPFWTCLAAVLFFSVLSLVIALRNLKKRLDFV